MAVSYSTGISGNKHSGVRMTEHFQDRNAPIIDQGLPLEQFAQQAAEQFREQFGRPPRWIAAAPGRVNLIGEHTDYNDGFVLPMAIDRYVIAAADRGTDGQPPGGRGSFRVHSATMGETHAFEVTKNGTPRTSDWTDYVRGVAVGCLQAGLESGSLDVLIDSNVPLGGGLSSSAALEVATATLIEAVSGQTLDRRDKALLCQRAEHEYGGVPCGIMDQFSSVMGEADHLMLLDCRSTVLEPVPLADSALTVLIINTNVKHELVGGEYAERRRQCEEAAKALGVPSLRDATLESLERHRDVLDDVHYRRARHVIGEIARTTRAADAIRAGDWPHVGRLMYESHQSLRDDYEVSCDELDLLVELTEQIGEAGGVIGCRMTGGGFGGCAVSLVKADEINSVARTIHDGYHRKTSIKPTIFVSRPARGAHLVEPGP